MILLFNHMLEQVELRDAELRVAKDHAEEARRVLARDLTTCTGAKGAEYVKSAVRYAKRAGYWTAFKDECESIVDRIADPMVQEVLRKALAE